jgi:hypothetical protein
MDVGDIEWDGVDWIGLALDRNNWRDLVNATNEPPEWLHNWWPLQ